MLAWWLNLNLITIKNSNHLKHMSTLSALNQNTSNDSPFLISHKSIELVYILWNLNISTLRNAQKQVHWTNLFWWSLNLFGIWSNVSLCPFKATWTPKWWGTSQLLHQVALPKYGLFSFILMLLYNLNIPNHCLIFVKN